MAPQPFHAIAIWAASVWSWLRSPSNPPPPPRPVSGPEFRARLLSALEKPKRGWGGKISAFVNSALFLWFLSAVLVTAISAFYTGYQQCAKDTSTAYDTFSATWTELNARHRHIATSVLSSSSFTTAREALGKIQALSKRQELTLFDLHTDHEKIRRSSDEPYDEAYLLIGDIDIPYEIQYSYIDYLSGQDPIPFNNQDEFESFKKYIRILWDKVYFGRTAANVSPNCTPLNVLKRYIFADNSTPTLIHTAYPIPEHRPQKPEE